jgi:hypothetical protein
MQYINPYELLGLNVENLSEIDSKSILKEKKKLLHEIELSDTHSIKHNGILLTKSASLRAIDDLDDKDKREFHFFIFQNRLLNEFLYKGSILFFEKYQAESIYKLPEFLDFISPYFASQYDKILAENFRNKNIGTLSKMIGIKPITNELFFERCYKRTYAILRDLDGQINKIFKEIELNESTFIKDNFFGLDSMISGKVDVEMINILPTYFQSLRNQLAQSIRNLSVQINNDPHKNYSCAYKLIKIAFSITSEGLVKQTLVKNYYIIKGNYDDEFRNIENQKLIEENISLVNKFTESAKEIDKLKSKSENKTENSKIIFQKATKIFDVQVINDSPEVLLKFRIEIATAIRGLAISLWNKNEDMYSALQLIDIALEIRTTSETNKRFLDDKAELLKLKEKYKDEFLCFFCKKNDSDDSSKFSKTIYIETGRSSFLNRRRVSYSYKTVSIPRCQHCSKIHENASNKFSIALILGIVVGVAIGGIITANDSDSSGAWFVGGLIGTAVGWIIGHQLRSTELNKSNIKSTNNSSISSYPPITELLRRGWQFSKPSA